MHKHLSFNIQPNKMQISIASRRRQPHLPPTDLVIGNDALEQVDCYHYLGVLVTSWADHIEHICCEARRLVGMLYGQFYAWADTSTMLHIYVTCICPHLEYVCQLWDPYTTKDIVTGIGTEICL